MRPYLSPKTPVWECIPHDMNQAYIIAVTYKGKGYSCNTRHIVRATGVTHQQAVLCWIVAIQGAINRGWKP